MRHIIILSMIMMFFKGNASAAIDPEVAESLKCARMFPFYEKKLNIPPDTLHSISLKETGKIHSKHKLRIVWPWSVNVEGKGHYFNSKREAINFVKKQLLDGKESIDVGCMQVNLRHHPEAFRNLEEAFDPRRNIAYGAHFLKSKFEQLGNWHNAIAHYHSATHELGSKYKQDVIRIAGNMDEYKHTLKLAAYNLPANYSSKVNKTPIKNTNYRYLDSKQKLSQKNYRPNRIFSERRLTKRINRNPHRYQSNMMVYVPKHSN